MLSKCSTSELHPHPVAISLKVRGFGSDLNFPHLLIV
jgi:hypothetical protein